ncbi:MAG: zf-HC2 domain-containing protein [Gemmatimonadales bacterium]
MDEHLGERLSAYVDGALEGAALAAAEAHLAGCVQCRAAAEGLRRVVGLARALDDRPPGRDLWSGIAERIGAAGADQGALVLPFARRRRFAFSLPQLAAAGLALSLLSAGAAATAVHFLAGRGAPASTAAAPVEALPVHVAATAAPYDAAITELEAILAARRGELDSSTVRTVEASLRVIDVAIAQARAALVRDPNNPYLNGHLRSTLDRKLDLLRRAAMLPRVT